MAFGSLARVVATCTAPFRIIIRHEGDRPGTPIWLLLLQSLAGRGKEVRREIQSGTLIVQMVWGLGPHDKCIGIAALGSREKEDRMINARTNLKLLPVVFSTLLLSACSVIGIRSGTDEPPYVALERLGEMEIRSYGPRLAADTIVESTAEDALDIGFSRLADYIFGNNLPAQKIDMTAPVAHSAAQISMTAPVVQESVQEGRYRVRFFMPDDYNLDSIPQPNSDDVEIVAVPEQQYAVIRYSGDHSMTTFMERESELLSALSTTPWKATGPVSAWFFDPPWTIPWLRRNEVAVPINR